MTNRTNASSGAGPSTSPTARPPVDGAPLREDHPVVGVACDALVRTQMPGAAVAEDVPEAKVRRPERTARSGSGVKLDPRFIPMALFRVGGTGLGVYLMTAIHPLAGVAAIAVSALVARAIAVSLAQQRERQPERVGRGRGGRWACGLVVA